MSDQLFLENYLLLLKSTVEVYVHGTLESCNEKVHDLLKECLNSTLDMQNDTFLEMMNRGWYQIENVDCSKISETYNKLDAKLEDNSEEE